MKNEGRTAGSNESELAFLDIQRAAALIRAKRVSPIELTRACLDRIEALNPSLNAFVTVTAEAALAQAALAEADVQRGRWRGPLHGIPVALKDLIDTAGVKTSAASALFKDRIPVEDAEVVARLKAAGAVLLGKLNLQEFAYGGTSVPSYFGHVSNPWNPERVAGGSSGGSAAAVAAGLCYATLGTDTGGSIREPAAFCGIVGLKPTYGRVSNRGVVPVSWSLDHVGPMTRSVADCASVLEVIAAYDPNDMASQDRSVGRYREDMMTHGPLKIGIPRKFFFEDLHPEIEAAIDQALAVFVGLGAQTRNVSLDVCLDRTVFRAEAYAYHQASLASTPDLYLPETRGKLLMGADIDAPSYIRAHRDLHRVRRSMGHLFADVDVLVTPTTPVPPPRIAEYPSSLEDALALDALVLRNTRPFNMFGLPTISVSCGMTRQGLPIGLQISGPLWQESRLLGAAQAYEAATQWHVQRPKLTS